MAGGIMVIVMGIQDTTMAMVIQETIMGIEIIGVIAATVFMAGTGVVLAEEAMAGAVLVGEAMVVDIDNIIMRIDSPSAVFNFIYR